MAYDVAFTPEARGDLISLYRYIANRSGHARAKAYIDRIEGYCRHFSAFPNRGTQRDDLLPGLRIVGFERRVTIAFYVDAHRVVFVRILYGGRSLDEVGDAP